VNRVSESASADFEADTKQIEHFKKIIVTNDCLQQQIFNLDERGLKFT